MAGHPHALTVRLKGQRSNPNPNRPALVCMSIRLHISLVIHHILLAYRGRNDSSCEQALSMSSRRGINLLTIFNQSIIQRREAKQRPEWQETRRAAAAVTSTVTVSPTSISFKRPDVFASAIFRRLVLLSLDAVVMCPRRPWVAGSARPGRPGPTDVDLPAPDGRSDGCHSPPARPGWHFSVCITPVSVGMKGKARHSAQRWTTSERRRAHKPTSPVAQTAASAVKRTTTSANIVSEFMTPGARSCLFTVTVGRRSAVGRC